MEKLLSTGDERLSVIEAAHSIVEFHVAAVDGFCSGCRRQWSRLALAPCEQNRWAVGVIETHGVAVWHTEAAA